MVHGEYPLLSGRHSSRARSEQSICITVVAIPGERTTSSDVAAPTTSLPAPHEAEADDDEGDDEAEELESVVRLDFSASAYGVAAPSLAEYASDRLRETSAPWVEKVEDIRCKPTAPPAR